MNIKQIRHQFPILSAGKAENPLVYLDNAATTQKPWSVIERITRFYSQENANTHRGIYHLAHQATTMYEQARHQVAEFIRAEDHEIVFCGGTTDALNTIAFGWGGNGLKPGDQVLVTTQEHHANFVPWQQICTATGAEMIVLPLNEDGSISLEVFDQYLKPQVKLVCLSHISNATGIINPVEDLIQRAHQQETLVVLDVAQSISYLPIDVKRLDCDFLTFSGHKIYGPMGVGILYGKQQWLKQMSPYRFGGGMIKAVSDDHSSFKNPPHKFEAGTPAVAQAVGLQTALEFVTSIGLTQIKSHADELSAYAYKRFKDLSNITTYGQGLPSAPIISFNLDGIHAHDVATLLGEQNIAVRAGHHCTQPLMNHFEIPATVRASFAIYNQTWEIDQLLDALQQVTQIMQ